MQRDGLACRNVAVQQIRSAGAFAQIQACAGWARHDCSYSRARSGRAIATPRPQLSRRGGRTAGSARRCTSRAAGGWRRPPRYRFYAASADHFGPERSSRVDRPRDRNARNAIVSSRDPDESFRSGTSRPRSCALATFRWSGPARSSLARTIGIAKLLSEASGDSSRGQGRRSRRCSEMCGSSWRGSAPTRCFRRRCRNPTSACCWSSATARGRRLRYACSGMRRAEK